MFENSKWIWINNENNPDEYADFLIEFDLDSYKTAELGISVDGNFEAYLNGEVCAFGSCSDYPNRKYYDVFPIGDKCRKGKNTMKITIWHVGVSSSVYVTANPGLLFEIVADGKVIAASGKHVPCRRNNNYTNGLCKKITSQLGLGYRYDNSLADIDEYLPATEVDKPCTLEPRGICNLELLERAEAEVDDNGSRLLIDLGKETAGYLDLDFDCDEAQELLVTFGEHLDENGHAPRMIGQRDFSLGFVAKAGNNKFLGLMRRIACRYIEIEYSSPIKVGYIGLLPVRYPVSVIEKKLENELHRRIYETSVYTLECCMHEHYEDCPWREQALYSLDSRNQMLCGYVAFGEYRYPRFNIILLSRSLKDGLIGLTSPIDHDLPIPFFSLTFIQQVCEYVKYSGDRSILDEIGDVMETVIGTFTSSIDESGLIPAFPKPAWNFFEWSQGNDGSWRIPNDKPRYDICLNSMYMYVLPMYDKLIGKEPTDLSKMKSLAREMLYDGDKGLFYDSNLVHKHSVIGNALALLAGLGDKEMAQRIINERKNITDNTLSMNGYLYDALLSVDKAYYSYIIADIERQYSYMLDMGATTFWETIDGASAFSNAGSLCHGWSALPIYYLTLFDNE